MNKTFNKLALTLALSGFGSALAVAPLPSVRNQATAFQEFLRKHEAGITKIQEEAGVAVTAVPGSNLGAGVPFVTKAQLARAAYNPTQALKKMAVANEELTKKKEQEDFVESRKGFNERAAKRKEERTAKRQEKLTKAGKVTRRVKI